MFDVNCNECNVRDDETRACPGLAYDAATKAQSARFVGGRGAHVNVSTYVRYQYQLNLPGSVSGSYSRNLNHLWHTGSVVALWDAPYVEWYYPALKDKYTHLSIVRRTARDVFAAVDEARLDLLRANAVKVRDRFLCPDCLANYFELLVHVVRDYFALGAVLDDPDRLRNVLEALDFDELQLVELEVVDHEYVQARYITNRFRLLDLAKHATHRAKSVNRSSWNDERPNRDWDELVTGSWARRMYPNTRRGRRRKKKNEERKAAAASETPTSKDGRDGSRPKVAASDPASSKRKSATFSL